MNITSYPLVVVCILLNIILSTLAAHTFDVYNMIHMERANPTLRLGSQKSLVNLLATTTSSTYSSFAKKIVIIPFDELNTTSFNNIVRERKAEGLLIIIPDSLDELPAARAQAWTTLEREFLQLEVDIPVYFAKSSEVKDIYQYILLNGDSTSGDNYQLAVTTDASAVRDVPITNIQGFLSGTATNDKAPLTITIVAYYDTFGLVPGMATGVDSNGSGVVALIELVRLFSKLYSSSKTRGKYNLQFILTSGGTLNFAGSKRWLEERANDGTLDNIEFAICLDTIGGEGLHLHVSRPPKDAAVQTLYESFTNTSAKLGVNFDISHKKINISHPDVNWEHEQFSRKRIIAGTLSHKSEVSPPFARVGLLDTKVNTTQVARNVRFVAEVLAKIIYGIGSADLFQGDYAVSKERLDAWIEAISYSSRVAPYLATNNPMIITGLESLLLQYLPTVSKETHALESNYTFFTPVSTQMNAYIVKPFTFDLYLSVVVLAYLVGLFAALKGKDFVPAVRALVMPKPQPSRVDVTKKKKL